MLGALQLQQLSLICFPPPPVPPQITGPQEPPTQVSVVQDREATLECNVTGKPPPRVTWERDGQPVGAEPGLRLQNQNQSLYVEQAQTAHAGRYSCVAKNVAGKAERRFALSVLGEDRRPAGGEQGGGPDWRRQGQFNLQAQPWAVLLVSHLVLPGVRSLVRAAVGGSVQRCSQIRTGFTQVCCPPSVLPTLHCFLFPPLFQPLGLVSLRHESYMMGQFQGPRDQDDPKHCRGKSGQGSPL